VSTIAPVRRLLYGVLCLALLAGIGLVQRMEIPVSEVTDPIPTHGGVGTPVDADTFIIEVHDVAVAPVVATPEGLLGSVDEGDEDDGSALEYHESAGVWIVAFATLTSTERPQRINSPVWLDTDEHTFAGAGELDDTLLDERLEAGIPLTGAFVLDVPPERIHDPVLRVNVGATDQRLSSEAVIDLGLGGDEIAQAAEDDDTVVEITPPTTE
jgi:hypothetical protein